MVSQTQTEGVSLDGTIAERITKARYTLEAMQGEVARLMDPTNGTSTPRIVMKAYEDAVREHERAMHAGRVAWGVQPLNSAAAERLPRREVQLPGD